MLKSNAKCSASSSWKIVRTMVLSEFSAMSSHTTPGNLGVLLKNSIPWFTLVLHCFGYLCRVEYFGIALGITIILYHGFYIAWHWELLSGQFFRRGQDAGPVSSSCCKRGKSCRITLEQGRHWKLLQINRLSGNESCPYSLAPPEN